MPQRKHLTELFIGFTSTGIMGIHPKNIRKIESESPEIIKFAEQCHIYLITKRPRISFVPGSLNVGQARTTGKIRYIKNGTPRECEFHIDGKPDADDVHIGDYPHSELVLARNTPEGERTCKISIYVALTYMTYLEDADLRNLEVVYVGMSYADGNRSAKDRLLSHSTLQQVLADLMYDAPDMDTIVLMVKFDTPQVLMSFDGRNKELKLENDRDAIDDIQKAEELLAQDVQISLIEACLIRYFMPQYNDKYKQSFPHPSHKILKALYDIDFNAIGVEINSECINSKIFSVNIEPGFHHMAFFDLHDPNVRQSFFAAMGADIIQNAKTMSGPAF